MKNAIDIDEVISALADETGPSRRLDGQIARILGWEKRIESQTEKVNGNVIEIGVWYRPDGSVARKVPFYTDSLQASYELVMQCAPNSTGASAKTKSGGRAQIDQMAATFASTQPLAMCIAALTYRKHANQ